MMVMLMTMMMPRMTMMMLMTMMMMIVLKALRQEAVEPEEHSTRQAVLTKACMRQAQAIGGSESWSPAVLRALGALLSCVHAV
jgi:hypothetical protein